ncbi:hypothetical protein [Piscinibacter sp.]|uniref:hypothetical protein n=1 Tax=Piscinibacter sp. TaxID=1903157 RepID=UPI0039E5BB18
MKTRSVVIHTGERFEVPQGIQRIDHRSTHGWQLRYAGTRLYSDGGTGAAASLAAARAELLRRIAKLPAPSRLRSRPSRHKHSDLPVGISGPVVRCRPGSQTMDSSLSVSLPRYGQAPLRRSIFIGTQNTYTPERFLAALARAVALREQAEAAYQRAATKAKRAEAQALREAVGAPRRGAKR